jgi:hypothetical protein
MQIRRVSITVAGILAFTVFALSGQEANPPHKVSMIGMPSEPVVPGACKSSTAGYLEKDGRTELSEAEIGHYVVSKLRNGYILTIYPQTQRGIFVDLDCTGQK